MGRIFWIAMGAIGIVLILLITSGDRGTVFGIQNDRFGSIAYATLWGALIGVAILGRGMRFGDVARQLAIWTLIILVIMTGYLFRYDAQDFASRFTGGLFPGSPISRIGDNGRKEVTLIRSSNGHFEVDARIDGKPVRFLVDTGASTVALSHRDAIKAGINTNSLSYNIPIYTANGRTMAAETRIGELSVGSITRKNQKVLVSAPGENNISLLGMSFLGSLSSYEVRGDRMFLRD